MAQRTERVMKVEQTTQRTDKMEAETCVVSAPNKPCLMFVSNINLKCSMARVHVLYILGKRYM